LDGAPAAQANSFEEYAGRSRKRVGEGLLFAAKCSKEH
jgi:hypothetical protein